MTVAVCAHDDFKPIPCLLVGAAILEDFAVVHQNHFFPLGCLFLPDHRHVDTYRFSVYGSWVDASGTIRLTAIGWIWHTSATIRLLLRSIGGRYPISRLCLPITLNHTAGSVRIVRIVSWLCLVHGCATVGVRRPIGILHSVRICAHRSLRPKLWCRCVGILRSVWIRLAGGIRSSCSIGIDLLPVWIRQSRSIWVVGIVRSHPRLTGVTRCCSIGACGRSGIYGGTRIGCCGASIRIIRIVSPDLSGRHLLPRTWLLRDHLLSLKTKLPWKAWLSLKARLPWSSWLTSHAWPSHRHRRQPLGVWTRQAADQGGQAITILRTVILHGSRKEVARKFDPRWYEKWSRGTGCQEEHRQKDCGWHWR